MRNVIDTDHRAHTTLDWGPEKTPDIHIGELLERLRQKRAEVVYLLPVSQNMRLVSAITEEKIMGVNNGSTLPTLPRILERHLRIINAIPDSELNPNEKLVARLIARIPYGKIASYGKIAEWAESKYGYTGGNARVVANIRANIYSLIGHYTDFPLWRLASQQDEQAANDSIITRIYGMEKRIEEGSWNDPTWFDPQKYFDPDSDSKVGLG